MEKLCVLGGFTCHTRYNVKDGSVWVREDEFGCVYSGFETRFIASAK